jgi:hypothetical protein
MDQLVGDGGEGNVGGEGKDRHCAEPLAQAPLCRLTHSSNFNGLGGKGEITGTVNIYPTRVADLFLEAGSGFALE